MAAHFVRGILWPIVNKIKNVSHTQNGISAAIQVNSNSISKTCYFPIAISILSVVQMILYLIETNRRESSDIYSDIENRFILTSDTVQLWRFVSYMLVHKDILHIGGNIFYQLATGVPLEIVYGWRLICIIYFTGVFGGSIAVVMFSSFKFLAGCSGGTYSIIGGYFCHLIMNWRSSSLVFNVWMLNAITVYLLAEFIQAICIPEQIPNQLIPVLYESQYCTISSEVSETAIVHLAGLLIGIGIILFRTIFKKPQ